MDAHHRVVALDAAREPSVFAQSIVLGYAQIAIGFSVNLLIALSASGIASRFARIPRRLAAQRYVMGFVLAVPAVRLAVEQRRGA